MGQRDGVTYSKSHRSEEVWKRGRQRREGWELEDWSASFRDCISPLAGWLSPGTWAGALRHSWARFFLLLLQDCRWLQSDPHCSVGYLWAEI